MGLVFVSGSSTTPESSIIDRRVDALSQTIFISNSVALSNEGTVFTWGWNDYGQLAMEVEGITIMLNTHLIILTELLSFRHLVEWYV